MVSIERPVVEDWPPGLAIASGAGTFYNLWGMLDILLKDAPYRRFEAFASSVSPCITMIIRTSYIATALVFAATLLVFAMAGCSAVQRISQPQDGQKGALRLDVKPLDTRIYIDAEYQGRVDGWAAQTVLLKPGERQVELRADGYMTRRFDIAVQPGEHSVLTVVMEADLRHLDGEVPQNIAPPDSPAAKMRALGIGK